MEKDSLLTETRLEALSSAHQLESLRETVTRMRNELLMLKSDNEKLQNIVVQKQQLHSSQSSLNEGGSSGSTGGTGNCKEDHPNSRERFTDFVDLCSLWQQGKQRGPSY